MMLMMLGMLLFWVLLILGAIWLVRVLFDHSPRSYSGTYLTPREILDQRYTRGEITKAEYDQVLTDLFR